MSTETAPPYRVRLSRSAGWRLPPNSRSVARPGRFGNPFVAGTLIRYGPQHQERFGRSWDYEGRVSAAGTRHDMWFAPDDIVETHIREATVEERVELYRLTLTAPTPGMVAAWPSAHGRFVQAEPAELAGVNLACWCHLDAPCHADVLLGLANEGAATC